jgi:hypothetical protein
MKATPEQMVALATVVAGIRPAWASVVDSYIANNAELLDLDTLARRAVGAACDPEVKVPSVMLTWEPAAPLEAKGDPKADQRHPEPLNRWRGAPRCEHGAIMGRCALCRAHVPGDDLPRRGAPPPSADVPQHAQQARQALAAADVQWSHPDE